MPLCQTSAPQATLARVPLAGFRRQTRCLISLVILLQVLAPISVEAVPLRLAHAQLPDTVDIHPEPSAFEPAPAPWLIAINLPTQELGPIPLLDAHLLARRFDAIAYVPLVHQAESGVPGIGTELLRLGEPRPIPVAREDDASANEGTGVYLIISSMALFSISALIGYVTRERPAYSLGVEWYTEGGRRTLPPLLLPPASGS
jgi:hypothetical protein